MDAAGLVPAEHSPGYRKSKGGTKLSGELIQQRFLESFSKSINKKVCEGTEPNGLDHMLAGKFGIDLDSLFRVEGTDEQSKMILESLGVFRELCLKEDALLLYYPVWCVVKDAYKGEIKSRIGSYMAVSHDEFSWFLSGMCNEDEVKPRAVTVHDPNYGKFLVLRSFSFLKDIPRFTPLRPR